MVRSCPVGDLTPADAEHHDAATRALVTLSDRYPDDPRTPRALLDAAQMYECTGRVGSAGRVFARIANAYGPRAHELKTAELDVIIVVALTGAARLASDEERALRYYTEVVETRRFARSPDDGVIAKRIEACRAAAEIFRRRGETERAADYEKCAE